MRRLADRANGDAPHRRAAGAVVWGALSLVIPLSGCAEPAMEVGPVSFSEDQVELLGEAQRESLADLAALGVLVADGRTDELVTPFVERELRSLMLQRLAMDVAVAEAGMDEAELRSAYALSPEPELVVRHLVVLAERWRTDAHRDSARARAEEALARVRGGERFEAIVAEYSDEPGAAERGGLLDPGREGSWVPEFWEAARALRTGEISEVVESEFGFHVIRLEERRAVPFEEVRGEVLERFVDLPTALSRAQGWTAAMAEDLRLDSASVAVWAREDSLLSSGDTLATWEAGDARGVLTVEALELYVATLAPEARAAALEPDVAAALELARGAARSGLLADRARRRGLEPSIAQRAALDRRWSQRVAGWSEAFDFAPGMRPRGIRDAALAGLAASDQATSIARRELPAVSGVLRLLVPVNPPAAPTR